MTIVRFIDQTKHILQNNSNTILTGIGVSGTITTAYLAGVASWKAANVLFEEPWDYSVSLNTERKRRVGKVWKLYIPAGLSGALTVVCVVSGARIANHRTAAAASVLAVTEKAFTEYREKIVETIGEGKERKVRDEIAQDRVRNTPPVDSQIIIASGKVLCLETYSGRYFQSDMEVLRRAQNDINAQLNNHMEASLSDFYDIIGLPETAYCQRQGWTSDKGMLKLDFTGTLTPKGEPCMAIGYNYIIPF